MKIEIGASIHNRFDIEVRDKDTGELKQRGQAENILLDRIYTRICNFSTYFNAITFGTGSGTLSPSRDRLFNRLGVKDAVTEEIVRGFPISKWTRRVTLRPEEYVGESITEVGISESSNLVYANTHALIKDSEGNPLSILKTDTDEVIIYATVFVELTNTATTFWDRVPDSNLLLSYLLGGTASGSSNLVTSPNDVKTNIVSGFYNDLALSTSGIADIVNKKIVYSRRIGTTVGALNRNTALVGFARIAGAYIDDLDILPYSIPSLQIGIGDGVKTEFKVPKKAENIAVKVNDVIVSGYTIGHFHSPDVVPLAVPAGIYLRESIGKVAIISEGVYIARVLASRSPDSTTVTSAIKFKFVDGVPVTIDHFGYGAIINFTISDDKKTLRVGSTIFYDTETFEEIDNPGGTFSSFADDIMEDDWEWYGAQSGLIRTDDMSGRTLIFDSPPPADSIITIDCDVPYLPKSEDYVLDVTCEIQFGEGVVS